jgi:hypothetical protein
MTTTNIQVSCSTATNWSYQLQCRSSLDAASFWSNIGSAASGTGGTVVFSDSVAFTNSTRFYRVQAR